MKLYIKTIIILIVITVVGVSGYLVWERANAPKEKKTEPQQNYAMVEDLLKLSVDSESVTTNFSDGDFVQVKFKFVARSEDAAEKLKKMSFKTQDTIIKTINQIKKSDALGPDGFTRMEEKVKEDLNKALGEKLISKVYLVEKLIQ